MSPLPPTDESIPVQQSIVDLKKARKHRKVLAHLYAQGTSTLANLAHLLQNSIPSVTGLVDELIQTDWIMPIGTAVGNNGRRPALFALNPNNHCVSIIDVSTHDTKILLMDTQRNVVFRADYNLPLADNEAFLSSLLTYFNKTLVESGISHANLLAVGISIPGLIDSRLGSNRTYPHLNQTDGSLTKWFAEQVAKPVYAINDTKAVVLGESRFGGAQGKQQVLTINIDWGVGLGVVVNGDVLQGAGGYAGELGHIQMDPQGDLCHCGKVGCLDTFASASALVQRVQRAIRAGQVSKLAVFSDRVEQIDIDELIQAAHHGDAYAIDILHEAGFHLGRGLAVAIHLFNPEIIIIDGILTKAADFILTTIEQAISKYCLSDFRNDVTLELTRLNGTAKWLGTHAHVMETFLRTTQQTLG